MARPRRSSRLVGCLAVLGFVVMFLALPELFPGNSRLYQAIDDGDVARVQQLLDAGADPNSRALGLSQIGDIGFGVEQRYRFTPFLFAIWRNEPDIALRMLRAGADPNARFPDGDTALIAAADEGMTELVRALVERGADVRAVNSSNGNTALHFGPALDVLGEPSPKGYLDPAIVAILERAGAR